MSIRKISQTTAGLAAALALASSGIPRRADADTTHFEAASVKLATEGSGIRRRDAGRISYEGISTRELLLKALGVPDYQIIWPEWIPTGKIPRPPSLDIRYYTINATMPSGSTDQQLSVMLQNLLRERFHLTMHRETRSLPLYEITIAEGGVKMRASPPIHGPNQIAPELAGNENIEAIVRSGTFHWTQEPDGGGARIRGQMTIGDLSMHLRSRLPHPMMDSTGLGGKYYDFDFIWSFSLAPGEMTVDDRDTRSLFAVMQKTLGLRVQLRTVPTDCIVVDNMDHVPTPD